MSQTTQDATATHQEQLQEVLSRLNKLQTNFITLKALSLVAINALASPMLDNLDEDERHVMAASLQELIQAISLED